MSPSETSEEGTSQAGSTSGEESEEPGTRSGPEPSEDGSSQAGSTSGAEGNSASPALTSSDDFDADVSSAPSLPTSPGASTSTSSADSPASGRSQDSADTAENDSADTAESDNGGTTENDSESAGCFWELCCAPDSELSRAVRHSGMPARRLTLETGFDFNKDCSQKRALELVSQRAGRQRGWASTPCTHWSAMQNLTRKTPARAQLLAKCRRKSRRLVKRCVQVLLAIVRRGGEFYYEWPHKCQGWQIPELRSLRAQTRRLGCEVHEVVFDGCAFGLRDLSGEFFLRKQWRVLTNDANLVDIARRCPSQGRDTPGHIHKKNQGRETSRSAFYPHDLCRALAAHWHSRM